MKSAGAWLDLLKVLSTADDITCVPASRHPRARVEASHASGEHTVKLKYLGCGGRSLRFLVAVLRVPQYLESPNRATAIYADLGAVAMEASSSTGFVLGRWWAGAKVLGDRPSETLGLECPVGLERQNGGVPVRVEVKPELLAWARERSGSTVEDLIGRFPKLAEWELGHLQPTLKQLEAFATATRTPVGFLYLAEPPQERLPIPDYRTMGDQEVRRPSPDLLDTIYQCEQRQDWYREFSLLNREDRLELVGSLATADSVVEAADKIRASVAFGVEQRGSTWTDAQRSLIDHIEELGILVIVSGVVGSNTHRKLDPKEFRGFALVDRLAPLRGRHQVHTDIHPRSRAGTHLAR